MHMYFCSLSKTSTRGRGLVGIDWEGVLEGDVRDHVLTFFKWFKLNF